MSASNTNILIKRSSVTTAPSSLKAGELAYSYLSNTAFIGTADGTGVVKIGGQAYTSQIDNATSAATDLTLVKRDASGNASFNGITANYINATINGNSNTATYLQNPQNFSISGGDITASSVLFNGSGSVTLDATLNNIAGLSNGSVGSSTSVPVIQYGANGRILSVSSAAISTTLPIAGNSGTDTLNLLSDTLHFTGTQGITTTVSGNTVTTSTDNTILRSNTAGLSPQTIGTDLNVSGNLTVTGATTYINTSIIQTNESIMHLASNNTVGDVIDIGFIGDYNNGSSTVATGLLRDAGSKNYFLFQNVSASALSGNTVANNLFTTANTATLYTNLVANQANATSANITTATIGTLSLTNALGVSSGGTGQTSFTSGAVLVGNNTGGLNTLANSTFTVTGTSATNSTVTSHTVDAYGRLTNTTYTPISGLTVSQGGTGQSAFTSGQIIVGNGTGGLQQIANVTTTVTGSLASNNTITSFATDTWGRVTSYTASAISGLTVSQGGTGLSTITQYGVTYGNGSGTLGVTAAAGVSDQTWSNQIMTVTNAGVPTWSTALDGGTF